MRLYFDGGVAPFLCVSIGFIMDFIFSFSISTLKEWFKNQDTSALLPALLLMSCVAFDMLLNLSVCKFMLILRNVYVFPWKKIVTQGCKL